MEIGGKTIVLCDCEGSMPLDGKAVARTCAASGPSAVGRHLCRAELDRLLNAAKAGKPLVVGCTQEEPVFAEALASAGVAVSYANIRERALWSDEAAQALPKVAALLTEAALDTPPVPALTLKSGGLCLVYGRDETAVAAALQLADRLDVTLLLSKPADIVPPRVMKVPIHRGTIATARGHLGAFEIVVDDYAPASPSSRSVLGFEQPRNGAKTRCDLILDLSGGTPLFAGGERRDGYLRPDPKNPAAVQAALFTLTNLVGEFEKPRYVDFHGELCAHSRSQKIGCTRCLDVCPTAAITPAGDSVAIDAYVCGGCGACHSVCPTGAAAYAMPPVDFLATRLRTLLAAYAEAGGERAALLVHDPRKGAELIDAMARFGKGLPARVIPFAVNEVTQLGFEFLALAFAYGAAQVAVLVHPEKRDELVALAGQLGLAESMLQGLGYGSGRLHVLVEADPEAAEAALYGLPDVASVAAGRFLSLGEKRGLTRLALAHLHANAPEPRDILPLPPGAPFGAVEIRVDGCTLCLACVGACPTGALLDNPDMPQLRFQEDACVQCGLCKATCPEKVISLTPRLNFTGSGASAVTLKEEPPFNCINCGKPFGTRSSIERIIAQLAGKHSMFRDEQRTRLIQMCEDCRVIVQIKDRSGDPFAGKPRPKPRTTEDYLRKPDESEP
ncbi:MAG: 4Fe-4S binding protein [Alphaproteobacteria bacterium]|nr:4Fe-4S binding protein [Alphaproteobacteria bacterium]